ncbi:MULTISPECIES: hypothetical protein [Anoxybacillus]|uniref:Phage protein n=2 Tax=Anoxybacillus flavithermus TaxID=33934 RepID=A0A178TBK2_9BACL|nr:hypothetical protein [Anoxybacillus flavithermus]EMT46107.1 hypothetical protein H919_07346 [Anoxybacillus flavithermus AK1]MBE2905171.1 hypothetical protein [Anoxybacillus flavithermus]MBE2909039.1 hypothetical protein [Anoxybacillus flavithermus]MBE2911732.1 hypothetical protein [Anoxybacillus flavithermus]MBE2917181.1 hypothetical protein [Anoxybacillus flavithermus]
MEKNLWTVIQQLYTKKVITQEDWDNARVQLSSDAFLSLTEYFNNQGITKEKGDQWL